MTALYAFGPDITLANAGDEVRLLDAVGALVDEVLYDGGAAFPDPNGASMSLDPGSLTALANDDGAARCESPGGTVGPTSDLATPGAPNPPCPP